MRHSYAVLDAKRNVIAADLVTWGKFFGDLDNRRVAFTDLGNGVTVSTVFLGMDHGFGGAPLWFESMAFGLGDEREECDRYETWAEAEAGHVAMVNRLQP